MSETVESREALMRLQFWLHRYWRWVVAFIIVIFVVVGGLSYWHSHKEDVLAKELYIVQTQFTEINAQNLQQAEQFIAQNNSFYAVLTQIEMASYYARTAQYNEAIKALNSARQKTDNSFLKELTTFRIARLQFMLKEFNESLMELNKITTQNWYNEVNQLKGDIYFQMGEFELAKQAYTHSLENNQDALMGNVLVMKLNQVERELNL